MSMWTSSLRLEGRGRLTRPVSSCSHSLLGHRGQEKCRCRFHDPPVTTHRPPTTKGDREGDGRLAPLGTDVGEARMRAVRLAYLLLAVVAGAAALPGEGLCTRSPGRELQRGRLRRLVQVGRHRVVVVRRERRHGDEWVGAATVSDDTSGATFTCTVNYGGSFVGTSVTVRKDSSPPSVNGVVSRDPDNNGWYTHPVDVGFGAEDGTSGLAGCSGSGTYGGPDSGGAVLSGTCTDNAGNAGSSSLTIRYDATPPTVAGKPSRPADANGWYNHPVDIEFTGSDDGSGIAECSPKVAYQGPDADPAKLVGQCRDVAGHLSAPITVELRYDSTPPDRPNVRWVHNGGSISLRWTAGKDVTGEGRPCSRPDGQEADRRLHREGPEIRRSQGRIGVALLVRDFTVRPCGQRPHEDCRAEACDGYLRPCARRCRHEAAGRRMVSVAQAHFYNLQLWRGKVNLLTTWVKAPKLKLPQGWKLKGPASTGQREVHALRLAGVWDAARPQVRKALDQFGFVVKRR